MFPHVIYVISIAGLNDYDSTGLRCLQFENLDAKNLGLLEMLEFHH